MSVVRANYNTSSRRADIAVPFLNFFIFVVTCKLAIVQYDIDLTVGLLTWMFGVVARLAFCQIPWCWDSKTFLAVSFFLTLSDLL